MYYDNLLAKQKSNSHAVDWQNLYTFKAEDYS